MEGFVTRIVGDALGEMGAARCFHDSVRHQPVDANGLDRALSESGPALADLSEELARYAERLTKAGA